MKVRSQVAFDVLLNACTSTATTLLEVIKIILHSKKDGFRLSVHLLSLRHLGAQVNEHVFIS